jgi:acyl-CoA synthetase (AMP-forming)/AMP-acid ligase II
MTTSVTGESAGGLLSLLNALVRHAPDATAAIDADPAHPAVVSRSELWHRTLRLRAELEHAGIGRGDCVAVWLPNWSDALCWQFATASLGAHVIGVNTRYNVEEVAHVLQRARPKVLAIAHGFHQLDLADVLHRAVRSAEAPVPTVAVVSPPGQPAADSPGAYDVGAGVWVPSSARAGDESRHDGEFGDLDEFADELAVAFTTSGSTGKPKLAAHTQRAVTFHATAVAETIGIEPGDVMLCALPLSGTFGFNTAMTALAGGAACLLEPAFDEHAVLADMARFAVTHAVGGDDMIVRLEEAWRSGRHDLSSWRWLGMADFLGRAPDLAEWARAEFGTVTAGVYGSSEVFALTAVWPDDEPAPRRWTGGGRLVSPRIQVRVCDPADGEVMSSGTRGELQFRGPNVVDAYLGDPDAAQRSFTADGWFRSGDLGELRPDGSMCFICRMGDVLRLRGFLVEPAEIEYRLAAHEAVGTAKVVGVRDDEGQTRAIAFVVLEPGRSADPEELRAWCGRTLARFKIPSAVHIIDEMPTTSGTNGTKIRAATLREWATHGVI